MRGTNAEFTEFVEAQSPALLGLAHALTGNRHDAWDLLQETLVRVGEKWRRIDQPAAYARTVMTRLNIDRIRRLRRELPGARPSEPATPGAEPGSSGTVTVHDASCGPTPSLWVEIDGTLGSEVEQPARAITGEYRS